MPFINEGGRLELALAQTNYKEHIATCFPIDTYSRNLPYEKLANVLNSVAVPVTLDNYLVCSVRGETATFQGNLSGFGKALNSADVILEKGSRYLFEQVKDVVFNETGMSKHQDIDRLKENLEMHLGGFVYLNSTTHRGFNIPLWIAETNLEKRKIEEMVGCIPDKYSSLKFVRIDPSSFTAFLQRKDLTPTIKPIWVYLALKTFGANFPVP